jgi:hypothetical protein
MLENFKTYASNQSIEKGGQEIISRSFWLRLLVPVGLGAMMLAVFCLLPGCGSESPPKKEKAAKSSGGKKMDTVLPMLVDKPEAGTGQAKGLQTFDKVPGMPTEEEFKAKAAKARSDWERRSPKMEILPGITQEQIDAKLAESRKRNPKLEVLPGLTQEQAEAKLAEARKRAPSKVEIAPGVTEEHLKQKADQARQRQEVEGLRPEQVLPQK